MKNEYEHDHHPHDGQFRIGLQASNSKITICHLDIWARSMNQAMRRVRRTIGASDGTPTVIPFPMLTLVPAVHG